MHQPFRILILFCALALAATHSGDGSPAPSPPAAAMKLSEVKAMDLLLFAPHPSYPYAARRAHAIGAGVAALEVDEETGLVKKATMRISTGSPILDENTLGTLRQWRFKPHTLSEARVPIHYTMNGINLDVRKQEKSMAEILAPFLGAGALRKAPTPQYPGFQNWGFKHGKGIYEIRVDPTGKVSNVAVLTSSGDPVFDEAVQKTLHKWQFTRGPLTVELPLSFALTPTSYRIDVAR